MRKIKSIAKAPFPAPDVEEVRELFDYNQETGVLVWKIERYRKHPGDIAGCKHILKSKNYRRVSISINYRRYLAHRIIWLWMTGVWPEMEIDHKDGDGWNNSWDNLREATRLENGKNLSIKKTNTTGVAGVSNARNGYFRARITVDRKEIQLGQFTSIKDASEARKIAEMKYFGEFAREIAQ